MTQLTFYLSIYVVSIFWCKWCWNKCIDEFKDHELFQTINKDFVINITSWCPIGNSIIAIIITYDLVKEFIEDKFIIWKTKRDVKKILKKISHNHKGEKVADDLNKIINQL